MTNFDYALKYTLLNEGGYSNEPEDSGGPTNFGITQHDYAQFVGHPVSADDVKDMSQAQAAEIYRTKYWTPGFDELDQGVATAIFDWGVLHGTVSARILAQQVVNNQGSATLKVDGVIGPLTITAINNMAPKVFISVYSEAVRQHFAQIVANNPSQKVFLKGWDARADRMLTLT